MAEYKKQVTFATVAAIALVAILASAVIYLPLGTSPTTGTQPPTGNSTYAACPPGSAGSRTNCDYSGGPSLYILVNGSGVNPTFTVSPGENITLVLDITSTQPLNVSLSVEQPTVIPSGGCTPPTPCPAPANGITVPLSTELITVPASGIAIPVVIGKGVQPGSYMLQIDAIVLRTQLPHLGFLAGVNLQVKG